MPGLSRLRWPKHYEEIPQLSIGWAKARPSTSSPLPVQRELLFGGAMGSESVSTSGASSYPARLL